MWLFNQPSAAARTALIYITIGTLTVIWTGVWLLYLNNNPPESHSVYYWCDGFLVTGLALIGIGFGLGQIGRSARQADHPAQEIAPEVVSMQPAAVTAVPVVPNPPVPTAALVAPSAPVVVPRAHVNQVSVARIAQ